MKLLRLVSPVSECCFKVLVVWPQGCEPSRLTVPLRPPRFKPQISLGSSPDHISQLPKHSYVQIRCIYKELRHHERVWPLMLTVTTNTYSSASFFPLAVQESLWLDCIIDCPGCVFFFFLLKSI